MSWRDRAWVTLVVLALVVICGGLAVAVSRVMAFYLTGGSL